MKSKLFKCEGYETKKFKSKVPSPIVSKTIKLSIARMNRFSVIHDYLVEKFTIKYSSTTTEYFK